MSHVSLEDSFVAARYCGVTRQRTPASPRYFQGKARRDLFGSAGDQTGQPFKVRFLTGRLSRRYVALARCEPNLYRRLTFVEPRGWSFATGWTRAFDSGESGPSALSDREPADERRKVGGKRSGSFQTGSAERCHCHARKIVDVALMTHPFAIDRDTGSIRIGHATILEPMAHKSTLEPKVRHLTEGSRDYGNGYEWLYVNSLSFGCRPAHLS